MGGHSANVDYQVAILNQTAQNLFERCCAADRKEINEFLKPLDQGNLIAKPQLLVTTNYEKVETFRHNSIKDTQETQGIVRFCRDLWLRLCSDPMFESQVIWKRTEIKRNHDVWVHMWVAVVYAPMRSINHEVKTPVDVEAALVTRPRNHLLSNLQPPTCDQDTLILVHMGIAPWDTPSPRK